MGFSVFWRNLATDVEFGCLGHAFCRVLHCSSSSSHTSSKALTYLQTSGLRSWIFLFISANFSSICCTLPRERRSHHRFSLARIYPYRSYCQWCIVGVVGKVDVLAGFSWPICLTNHWVALVAHNNSLGHEFAKLLVLWQCWVSNQFLWCSL